MTRRLTAGWPALVITLTIGGCWHDETNHDLTRPGNPLGVTGTGNGFTPKYIVVASDGEGYVNLYGDDGLGVTRDYGAIAIKQSAGTLLPLGEVHLYHGRAFVLITSGLRTDNGAGTPTGGGVAIVDLAKAVANIADASAVEILPLVSDLTAKSTRITRATVEPAENYVWLSNAGPEGDGGSDSVFRLNWSVADTEDTDGTGIMDDKFKDVVEVTAGNGDKHGSHSQAPEGSINASLQFAACNVEDQTLSLIGNDHMKDTFMKLVKTISLGNTPGGVTYSKFSGKYYVGMTSSPDTAVTVVTATPIGGAYTVANIAAGADANQIPAGGAVRVSDNGEYIYVLGYKSESSRGYLSVVEADVRTGGDSVKHVINLGDITAEHASIATMSHGSMQHARMFIPATSKGGVKDKIVVIELDPITGLPLTHFLPTEFTVGVGHDQRHLVFSPDHARAYVPNGGDCTPTPGPDCKTIAVVDVMHPAKMATLTTRGQQAQSVAALYAADLGVQPPPVTGGGGHNH